MNEGRGISLFMGGGIVSDHIVQYWRREFGDRRERTRETLTEFTDGTWTLATYTKRGLLGEWEFKSVIPVNGYIGGQWNKHVIGDRVRK